jgi:pSer/pThr/pTyr-binding forkhead associated (FHA) protein
VPESPLSRHAATPRELKEQIEAARLGLPLLVYRDEAGTQHVKPLDGERVTVGRDATNDVALTWDAEVSRVHAELVRVGVRWALTDDGLSRNGSFVNGARITGRRPLEDGDVLRFGATTIGFRNQLAAVSSTVVSADEVTIHDLSDTQRRVLKSLCAPIVKGGGAGAPAPNQQIADELFLSVDAVKKQLRSLFHKFDLDDLPQNQKRARLAETALRAGLVSLRDAD